MRRALAFLAVTMMLAGCQKAEPQTLAVQDAWVRLAAVPGRPAAAYLTLKGGPSAERLVAATSPQVARIELHESGKHDGVMTMRRIDGVDIPANGTVGFAPGGNHAMLFGVDPAVRPGGILPISLRFASGLAVEASASVQAAGDAAPDHQGH